MSLFGGAASQSRTRNLVEFKAGKMNLRGTMVHPDKRKGLVYIHQGNDSLMHFCWKDRSSNGILPEDDLVLFPEEVEFKKVTRNTTGRVYILKWKTTGRKIFFWMQEPKEDKDDELCRKVNNFLNNPPAVGFGDESGGSAHLLQPLMDRLTGGAGGGLDTNDFTNVIRGMHPNEFASFLSSIGGAGGAGLLQDRSSHSSADSRPNTAPAGTQATGSGAGARSSGVTSRPRESPASSSSAVVPSSRATSGGPKGGPIQLSALSNVLSSLGTSPTPGTADEGSAQPSKSSTDLNDMKTRENLIPLLINKDVQEKLRPHLPDGHTLPKTEQEFRDAIQSPQVREAITALSAALQAGQLGSVLTALNFSADVIQAANQGDVQAFAQALEKHYQSSNDQANEGKASNNTMDTS